MNLFEDDFANLAEEEDHPGHKSITTITEYQSFSDLTYSKGKMVSCIDWMPGKQGILAAACSESKPFDERLQNSGKPSNSFVLIWSFLDPIHPQIILESLSDIFSLRFNPTKPGLIAGGCYNGQNGDILEGDINVPDGYDVIKSISECHNGPVRSLQRSPFFDDIILSVDIWTFALWRTGLKKPIFVSRSVEGYLTAGCWSPSRPGVLYIGSIDGSIEVWDLLDHSHQPSLVASIGSCQVTSMEFCSFSPQLLAVGDIQGILHIMEIPRRLRRIQHKEKAIMQKFFERQETWVKNVEGRTTERTRQSEKRQKEESAKKERERQLAKCCWNDEMEAQYQQYEMECRLKFGVPLTAEAVPKTSIVKKSIMCS